MRLPGSSAGRVGGACSPCTGRGLASRPCRQGRWWALTPPFHPYRPRLRRFATGGLFSVPLSVGFRRLPRVVETMSGASCPAVSGLSSSPEGPAVTQPARRILPRFRHRRFARVGASSIRGSARASPRGLRTRRRPGTRATPRAGPREAPARVSGGGASQGSQLPEHPHDLAEDLDVLSVDRLERGVLGLQPDAAALAEEPLHRRLVRRLVVAGERDDDLAVPRVLSTPHDDDVAVEDAGLDHRLALDAQQEVAAKVLGHRDLLLDVLLGQQRSACCDLPEERQLRQLRDGLRPFRCTLAPADELECPRLRRVSAQQSGALEVGKVRVDGGGRCKADGLADLPHGGGISVAVDIADEEAPDLALPAGQLGCGLHLTLRGSGTVPNTCSRAGYGLLRTASTDHNRKAAQKGGPKMRWRGLEPPRPVKATRPST